LTDISMDLKTKKDLGNEKAYSEMRLSLTGNELLSMGYYKDKEKVILDLKDLYPDKLSLKHSEMKNLLGKMGIDASDPFRKITADDLKKALIRDKKEYDDKLKNYQDYIFEYFSKEEFSSVDTNIKVAGMDIECKKVSLNTSGEKMSRLITDLVGMLEKDEELQFLAIESLERILKLLEDKGYYTAMNIFGQNNEVPDSLEIKEGIEELLVRVKNAAENINFTDEFDVWICLDDSNDIISYGFQGKAMMISEDKEQNMDFVLRVIDYETKDRYSEKSFYVYMKQSGEDYLLADVGIKGIPVEEFIVEYTSESTITFVEGGNEIQKAEFLLTAEETKSENKYKLDIGNCELYITDSEADEVIRISASGSDLEKIFTDEALEYDIDLLLYLNTDKAETSIDTSVGLSVFKDKENERYDTSLKAKVYVEDGSTNDDPLISIVLEMDQALVPGKPEIDQAENSNYLELSELDESELQGLMNQVMGNLLLKVLGEIKLTY